MKRTRLVSVVRDGDGARCFGDRQMRGRVSHLGRQLLASFGVILALGPCVEGARPSAAGSTPASAAAPARVLAGPARRHPVHAESDLTRDLTQLTVQGPSTREIRRLLGPY